MIPETVTGVTGANQNAQKLLSTDLVNTNNKYLVYAYLKSLNATFSCGSIYGCGIINILCADISTMSQKAFDCLQVILRCCYKQRTVFVLISTLNVGTSKNERISTRSKD